MVKAAWKCEWCETPFDDKERARKHENNCMHNAERHCCSNCCGCLEDLPVAPGSMAVCINASGLLHSQRKIKNPDMNIDCLAFESLYEEVTENVD